MNKLDNALYEIYYLDTLAQRDQWVNKLHPLVKFIITIIYIITLVSFAKYDVLGVLGMGCYPLLVFNLAQLSFTECLWRLRLVLPLVAMVGLANPLFDHNAVTVAGYSFSAGWLSMVTLMLKGIFAVLASYLLIATTSVERLCYALRQLHVPKLIVTQLLLTYRYITLLLRQAETISQAYALRAPKQKGIHFKVWGSLTGQLLLRSMDRATALYESMTLRGFQGEFYYNGEHAPANKRDWYYLAFMLVLIAILKYVPILNLALRCWGGKL